MNRILLPLSILNFLGIVIILSLYLSSSLKVVYVDSQKLVNGYQGMIDARKQYQQKATSWKANIDTLTSEVQKQIMDYERAAGKMSVKERELSQELIKTKQKQLYEYQQAMNNQAQQEDSKMTGEVLTQINTYLKTYGEKQGYTIIMAATEYGNLAYADEKLDITEDVLAGLNNQYAGR